MERLRDLMIVSLLFFVILDYKVSGLNLAFGQRTWGEGTGNRTVDGDLITQAMILEQQTPWTVDLGEPRFIQRITLHRLENGSPMQFKIGIYVISVSPDQEGQFRPGAVNWRDNKCGSFDGEMGPGATNITCSNVKEGRYVLLWLQSSDTLALTEVEVFAYIEGAEDPSYAPPATLAPAPTTQAPVMTPAPTTQAPVTTLAPDANCPVGWSGLSSIGKCFKLYNDEKTFCESHDACLEDGAVLASIADNETHVYLRSLMQENNVDVAWVGLYKPADQTLSEGERQGWLWLDGSDYDQNVLDLWANHEPTGFGHCAHFDYDGWWDFPCDYYYTYICQKGSYERAASQIAFWPLNEEHEGENVLSDRSDATNIVLTGVSYDSNSNGWPSNPVRFNGQSNSYGVITGGVDVGSGSSFSWMGAVFRHYSRDGALFEWDNGGTLSTHIWILTNKLYINLFFKDAECTTRLYHGQTISTGEQHFLAASFDSESHQIALYVDGVANTITSQCTEHETSFGPNASINRRINDSRRMNAEVTCFGLFNEAISYDEMYRNTIEQCHNRLGVLLILVFMGLFSRFCKTTIPSAMKLYTDIQKYQAQV